MASSFGSDWATFDSMGFQSAATAPSSGASAGAAGGGMSGLGTLGMGLSIAGMLTGVIGSFYTAQSTQSALRFQADMAEINAKISETAAQQEMYRGEKEVQSVRLKGAQLKSSQRVAMAANGLDLGSDTPVNVLTSTDVMTEYDANMAHTNAVRAAWGYRTQGVNYTSQAAMSRANASGINPIMTAGSSLLGGAGNVATNWYLMNKGVATNTRSLQ